MAKDVSRAQVSLNRDSFFRRLLRDLSGTLEEVIGLEFAEGYISTVGGHVGQWIDEEYRAELGAATLSRDEVAQVCVDLKRRIGGDFFLISADDEKLVFGNRRCPFGEMVRNRPSLCMMTSNVFGRITANNLGYARVALDETIARGAPGCRVVVHLRAHSAAAPHEREYFQYPGDPPSDET